MDQSLREILLAKARCKDSAVESKEMAMKLGDDGRQSCCEDQMRLKQVAA